MNELQAELYSHDLSAATWGKSSASGAENNCVEITDLPRGGIAVRDSKDTTREPLRFDADEHGAVAVLREGRRVPLVDVVDQGLDRVVEPAAQQARVEGFELLPDVRVDAFAQAFLWSRR